MKKVTTSLTVDGDVVTRARTIIEKSALPYSVSKLVTMLVFEAFDAIETAGGSLDFPLVAQFRRSIHGTTAPSKIVDITPATPPPELLASIDTAIRRILAEREEDTALAAEQPAKYITRKKK